MIPNAFSKAKIGVYNRISSRLAAGFVRKQIPVLRSTQHGPLNLPLNPVGPFSQNRTARNYNIGKSSKTNPIAYYNTEDDTIYALSTAAGRAAIAIVRISGPGCQDIYHGLTQRRDIGDGRDRKAKLRELYDPFNTSNILDTAIVLFFPSPDTVTGEDILELHIHGGNATVKAVLAAIAKVDSRHIIRYAEAGEFTRRAFQNNKLDLGQVEALSDALSAETEHQRRAAMRGNSGKLGRTYDEWRELLLNARGELEALIDFSEDQHFDESPAELMGSVTNQIRPILGAIQRYQAGSRCGELLKRGIRISLLGPPNAGKSSLLNLIVNREASIVSEEAGTTRDIVEVSVDIGGYLCVFADTAGLRSASTVSNPVGAVEQEGIRRAKAKAKESDLVIVLASVEESDEPSSSLTYCLASRPSGLSTFCDLESLKIAAETQKAIIVINKCDRSRADLELLLDDTRHHISTLCNGECPPIVQISCRDAANPQIGDIAKPNVVVDSPRSPVNFSDPGNIRELLKTLESTFAQMTDVAEDDLDLLGVSERQSQLLSSCTSHLELFTSEALQGDSCDIVVAAEHLRAAATCLARITGRGEAGDVEEVLGVVFEKFCVGK